MTIPVLNRSVSAVVINYNGGERTMRCLEALTRQPQLFQLLRNSIALTNRGGPVEITRIESDVTALQITQSPAGSSEKFRLDVALAPDKVQRGSIAGTISIATTNPDMPVLTIPVRGEVK